MATRLRFREPWPLHRCSYLPLIIVLAFLLVEVEGRASSKGCSEREKDALLLYKAAIEDPSARLSSWRARVDCCAWTGVVCHNTTGSVRVAELNLQNPNDHITNNTDTALRGELLHPSLLSLTHLLSLDLSFNDFEGAQIPPLIGSLRKLRSLDLSGSNFTGIIPPHLGNLTNLRHLDLNAFKYPDPAATIVHSLDWLSGLSSLIYLDMSYLNLTAVSYNWVSAINKLPSLQQLYLHNCGINNIPLSLDFHLNLTSLTTLDLGWNNFNSSFPNWLSNLTSLSSLQLGSCNIQGTIPTEIDNLNSLTLLDLSHNSLSGPLPDTLWKLKHLTYLNLGSNLHLIENSLPVGIMNLSSLSILSFDSCSLFGPIPHEIGKLVNLEYLDLSSNFFDGDITEIHLSNLTRLEGLFLSYNPFLTIAIDNNWTPPFQLDEIVLSFCKLGPRFPTWLNSQKSITLIDLQNASIEDDLPELFLNSLSIIGYLDLSHNKISGTLPGSLENLTELFYLNFSSNLLKGPIPHLPPNLNSLDLSNNAFSGPLPATLFTPHLEYLILSQNHINGSIPSKICNSLALRHLNLSNNQIFGEIPQCWQKYSFLRYINLENNMLHGEIPSSLGNLMELESLHLNNNTLRGHLPPSLQNCTQLVVVDLGDNKFSGSIPSWIGQSLQKLRILRLRSNMFNGKIDQRLGYLTDLQIIDFANNKLSGPIPHSFGNLSAMVSTSVKSLLFHEPPRFISQGFSIYDGNDTITILTEGDQESLNDRITIVTKGHQESFSSILYLVKSMDLSNNELTNEIPEELEYLAGLHTLNLSRNYFNGKIPDNIGRMSSLETLDLSFNNLSRIIPQSLSQLNALNHLNLSYNNLSGNIPSGDQLQTLDDASIYIGNPYLCGVLVNKSCFSRNNIIMSSEEHAMLSPMLTIYFSGALGFFVGLWIVFVLLLFKKKWRFSYFNMVDEIYDKVYVIIKIRWNRIVNN